MMLLIRSMSTALPLFSSGRKCWPAPGSPSGTSSSAGGGSEPGARGRVGWQSTYFSPRSDWGRIRQVASWRKSWKPASSIFITTTALPGSGLPSRCTASPGSVTSTDDTEPTVAPATRTSSPGTRKPPLSKIARTSYSSPSPLAAWPNTASMAVARSATMAAILLIHHPGGHVGGVALRVGSHAAAQQIAVIRERVGAGDRLGRAARAAGEEAELEVVELLARAGSARARPAIVGTAGGRAFGSAAVSQ